MAISQWPTAERPREKLLSRGAAALSDAELLAIFLRSGVAGSSAVSLARQLLSDFGSLRGVLGADAATFCRRKGLGPVKFVQLQAALEIARRHFAEELDRGDCLTRPAQTMNYLRVHLRDYRHEVFACLMLDNRNRVIALRELFRGTIDGASVYPREVVKQALRDNAAAVILAHNHPSGVSEPSQADIRITERLQKALALVDIRVLDHVIVG
ncbi:MAG: DNA repair protein RadC, partial [Gammaproteobacteria bacterium]